MDMSPALSDTASDAVPNQPRERAPASWGAEFRATLALAWPLVLANLAQTAIFATDVLFIGWLGAEELAASALATNLISVLMFSGTGLVMAVSPLIASELGARSNSVREVRRSVRMGLWVAILFSLVGWFILWNAEWILVNLLGQNPMLAAKSGDYMMWVLWSLMPALGIATLRIFVSALDRPQWALVVTLMGVAVNAGLNWLLIFGNGGFPKMGLQGAGLASTLTNIAMFSVLAGVILLDRKFKRYHIFGRFHRWDGQRVRDIIRLGTPIAFTLAFEVTVFSAAVFLMGLISTESIAAHAVALQLAAVTFMVPLGISQATTIRVGLAYGAKNQEWISRAGWASFVLAMCFMTVAAAIMWIFPESLIGLFIDAAKPENAGVFALAVSFLGVAAVFQLADGAQVVGAAMLRGLHDTRVPMIFAAIGYWLVGFGGGAALAFWAGWEGVGVWTGLALGLTAVAILMLWRWMRREQLGLLP